MRKFPGKENVSKSPGQRLRKPNNAGGEKTFCQEGVKVQKLRFRKKKPD